MKTQTVRTGLTTAAEPIQTLLICPGNLGPKFEEYLLGLPNTVVITTLVSSHNAHAAAGLVSFAKRIIGFCTIPNKLEEAEEEEPDESALTLRNIDFLWQGKRDDVAANALSELSGQHAKLRFSLARVPEQFQPVSGPSQNMECFARCVDPRFTQAFDAMVSRRTSDGAIPIGFSLPGVAWALVHGTKEESDYVALNVAAAYGCGARTMWWLKHRSCRMFAPVEGAPEERRQREEFVGEANRALFERFHPAIGMILGYGFAVFQNTSKRAKDILPLKILHRASAVPQPGLIPV